MMRCERCGGQVAPDGPAERYCIQCGAREYFGTNGSPFVPMTLEAERAMLRAAIGGYRNRPSKHDGARIRRRVRIEASE